MFTPADADLAMMVHGGPVDWTFPSILGARDVRPPKLCTQSITPPHTCIIYKYNLQVTTLPCSRAVHSNIHGQNIALHHQRQRTGRVRRRLQQPRADAPTNTSPVASTRNRLGRRHPPRNYSPTLQIGVLHSCANSERAQRAGKESDRSHPRSSNGCPLPSGNSIAKRLV